MKPPVALLDSNVVIAAIVEDHVHHPASARLLTGFDPASFGIAAHSYAEAYVTLTRQGPSGSMGFPPSQALAALSALRAVTTLVGATPSQTVEAVGRFAARGGIGPRLYDTLIGEAAVANGIGCIITWNIRHLAALFPGLPVMTPSSFLAKGSGEPSPAR